jgi:iron(III) transport system substrate-binding protein
MNARARALVAALALTLVVRSRAGAQSDGSIVWYTSVETPTISAITQRFNAGHPGLTLQAIRVAAPQIPPRVMTEQTAHAPRVDVVSGDLIQIDQLGDLGDLQPYRPPDAARFIKGALDPRGFSVAMYLTTIVIAWNPATLKREGLAPPRTLADFAAATWSGRLGVSATAYNWLAGTLATHPDAGPLLTKLAANKPYRSSGYTVTITQLEAGEFDATPTAYGYYVQSEKMLGRNVDFALPRPQLVDPAAIALVKDAPHPREARIFLDWMLSKEGQQLIIDVSDRTSARTDVLNDRRVFNPALPYYVVPAEHKAEYDALVRRFNAFFGIAG